MIGIRCLRCHTPLAMLDEPHRCSALTRRPALLYGALVAERNALRTALVEAQAAWARVAEAIRGVSVLSSGNNAASIVPCLDRFDYDAMEGVRYVILYEADWQRVQAALADDDRAAPA